MVMVSMDHDSSTRYLRQQPRDLVPSVSTPVWPKGHLHVAPTEVNRVEENVDVSSIAARHRLGPQMVRVRLHPSAAARRRATHVVVCVRVEPASLRIDGVRLLLCASSRGHNMVGSTQDLSVRCSHICAVGVSVRTADGHKAVDPRSGTGRDRDGSKLVVAPRVVIRVIWGQQVRETRRRGARARAEQASLRASCMRYIFPFPRKNSGPIPKLAPSL